MPEIIAIGFLNPGPFQVCKYSAKLKLLEHGLLDAAKSIDDLQQRSTQGEDEDDEKIDFESDEDFIKRLKLFVAVHLHRASSSKRDDYKETLVYQARKEVIQDFLRIAILKACQNGDCAA